jgi:AcrR family transcriptional regulator
VFGRVCQKLDVRSKTGAQRSKKSADVREQPTFIEAARRKQIVECAVETIAELGYARASLAEIAKRAGISKSVISYYFASKDELIQSVVDLVFATGTEFMAPRVHAQTTARAALRAYIESNMAFMRAHRTLLMALMEIIPNFRDEAGVMRLQRSELEPAAAALGELLKWGQSTGEFRSFDTRTMAQAIRSVIDGVPGLIGTMSDEALEAIGPELAELFDRATRV